MKDEISLQRPVTWCLYGVLATLPLLFGAVHPIVEGVYSAAMLVLFGSWLLLNNHLQPTKFSCWLIIPLLLIAYVALQAVPLPYSWIEFLSPSRAQRVQMVAQLTGVILPKISLSEQSFLGFYRALYFLALLFYYCTLRHLFKKNTKIYIGVLYIIAGLGTFEAFYGLLQFVKPHIGTLWLKSVGGRGAHGTIIYKNQFASLMNMIWPVIFAFGAATFLQKRKQYHGAKHKKANSFLRDLSGVKLRGPLFIFLSGFMALSVIFSLSRGGIISFLVTASLLMLFLPFSLRIKALFFTIFISLICSYGALLGWDTITTRFGSVGGSASTRMSIYISSLQMVLDHWLTGIGMGAYELLSAVYIKWLPVTALADRAHCEYLELYIELGIPMASLLFIWIGIGMFHVLRTLRQKDIHSSAAVVGIAAWCGLISFLAHGLIDFGWRLPANLFYAITLLALATEADSLDSLKRKKRKFS